MYPAMRALLTTLVVTVDLTAAPPLEMSLWPPRSTEKVHIMPNPDAYLIQERSNVVPPQEIFIGTNGSYGVDDASREAVLLPSKTASRPNSAELYRGSSAFESAASTDNDGDPAWFSGAVTHRVLRFLQATQDLHTAYCIPGITAYLTELEFTLNTPWGCDGVGTLIAATKDLISQVVFYITCSCLLTGLVVLYMLMTLRGCRSGFTSGRSTDSSRRLTSESYLMLDRQPLLSEGDRRLRGEVSPGESDELYSADQCPRTLREHSPSSVTTVASDIAVAPKEAASSRRACAWPVSTSRKAYSITASSIRGPARVLQRHKEFVMQPITVFPSRLLDMCNQDAPITFAEILPNPERSRSKWIAHGRHSEVFLVSSLLKRVVFKVMPVLGDFSEHRVEVITAAIECYLKLGTLRHGTRYKAPNFIEVQRIACVFDTFPEWLQRNDPGCGSTESLVDSLASEMAGMNQCCLTRHFVVLELGYSGKPLSKITLRSAIQGRSLVQQAACCVAVAERALGFLHLGVDADKLLVAPIDAESLEYRFTPDADPMSIESAGLKAYLSGCLSCALDTAASDEDDFEYHEDPFGSPTSDCSSRATPRFYGNVMWLAAVLDSVLRKLRSEVPEPRARAERGVFEGLLAWQGRLQQCNSAQEFVAAMALAAQT